MGGGWGEGHKVTVKFLLEFSRLAAEIQCLLLLLLREKVPLCLFTQNELKLFILVLPFTF